MTQGWEGDVIELLSELLCEIGTASGLLSPAAYLCGSSPSHHSVRRDPALASHMIEFLFLSDVSRQSFEIASMKDQQVSDHVPGDATGTDSNSVQDGEDVEREDTTESDEKSNDIRIIHEQREYSRGTRSTYWLTRILFSQLGTSR